MRRNSKKSGGLGTFMGFNPLFRDEVSRDSFERLNGGVLWENYSDEIIS